MGTIAPIGLGVPKAERPDLSRVISSGSGASDESVRVGDLDLDTDKLDDPLTVLSTLRSSVVKIRVRSEPLGRRTGLKIEGFNIFRGLT